MIANDALGSENGPQGSFQRLGRICRKRGQGRGCFHGLREVCDELPGQLRIGEKIGDVIPTRTQTDDGIEGDGH